MKIHICKKKRGSKNVICMCARFISEPPENITLFYGPTKGKFWHELFQVVHSREVWTN